MTLTEFLDREDNPSHLTPKQVVMFSNPYVDFEGGGLPLGSGDLIRAAQEFLDSRNEA